MNRVCLFLMAHDSKTFMETLKESLEKEVPEIDFTMLYNFNSIHGKRIGISFLYNTGNLQLIMSKLDDNIKIRLGIQLVEQ